MVELNAAVDTGVTVSSSWTKDSSPVISDGSGRITVSDIETVRESPPLVLETSIVFSPGDREQQDSGVYTCTVIVSPDTSFTNGTTGVISRDIEVLSE